MIHRPLGQTGLELSPIGLGTVKIGRNTDVKYPADFELPSDDDIIELLTLASELGINCLDTAPALAPLKRGSVSYYQRSKPIFVSSQKLVKPTILTQEVITTSQKSQFSRA